MSAIEIVVVEADRLEAAWQWLVSSLSPRPETPSGEYIYDHKAWNDGICDGSLVTLGIITQFLGVMYLASQVDYDAVVKLANEGTTSDVVWPNPYLDSEVANVIGNVRRFRNHLSEHISCWTRLATERIGSRPAKSFAHTKPNIRPEETGPDGLFLAIVESGAIAELLSVKNSIGSPQEYVSSKSFREKGKVDEKGKEPYMLNQFWLVAHGKAWFIQVDGRLSEACRLLSLDADQKRRNALRSEMAYNGVIVADDSYASATIFAGFQHVLPHHDPTKCIGTYIGSRCWDKLAEAVRQHVLEVLQDRGLM